MGNCIPKPPPPQSPKKRVAKKAIPKTLKRMVWDTYIGASKGEAPCFCCEHATIRQIEFHCGHIKAEARGGSTTVDNLRPICAQCNLSMGTMDLQDFKQKFMNRLRMGEVEARYGGMP